MNHNYPEWIVGKVEEILEENGRIVSDEEVQEMSEPDIFALLLEWEGIIGYNNIILDWIKGIWGYNMIGNGIVENVTKKDYVRAFGTFVRHHDLGRTGVQTMEMDEREHVTITYEGGGTHIANIEMDSFSAAIRDIMKNI